MRIHALDSREMRGKTEENAECKNEKKKGREYAPLHTATYDGNNDMLLQFSMPMKWGLRK